MKSKSNVFMSLCVQPIANNKKISPTLLYNTALKLDFKECCLSFQKEINKYEHKPTNSQEKNSTTKLLIITKPFIAKANIANNAINWL